MWRCKLRQHAPSSSPSVIAQVAVGSRHVAEGDVATYVGTSARVILEGLVAVAATSERCRCFCQLTSIFHRATNVDVAEPDSSFRPRYDR